MNTSQKIIQYVQEHGQATGSELVDYLAITDRAVRKQLKTLLDNDVVVKTGKPPKVYYSIRSEANNTEARKDRLESIDKAIQNIVKDNFLYITPRGTMLEGLDGFVVWCEERKLDPIKTAAIYQKTIAKYQKSQQRKNQYRKPCQGLRHQSLISSCTYHQLGLASCIFGT